ncbi:hypothetical protein KR018_012567 [Drosophila ironensis]|nr:hypothetical protein KR018_012567 [Drosophila ironensis]
MLLQPMVMHLSQLLRLIVGQYFSSYSSILIVYNNSGSATQLQLDYLSALQSVLRDLHQPVLLQWIDVAKFKDPRHLDQHVFKALNCSVTEVIITQSLFKIFPIICVKFQGFITILPRTKDFLHARYYATRNSVVRLKDKRYLFLCEDELPADLLALDILQFYPHHLMVRPVTETESEPDPGPTTGPLPSALGRKEGTSVNTTPHRDINFELWTQKFVGASGNLDAVRLDAFLPNETLAEAERVELYPNKLLNLQGRSLRVGSITYVPYTITNYVPAGEGDEDPLNPRRGSLSIAFDGAEANVMKTFCQLHNCHLMVEPYGADNWGGIYDNGSSDGMLGDIYQQRVELAIGCIYNWYNGITETSQTIARSSVTILGPAPAPLPSWRTNIMPFNDLTWLLLILTMLACGIFLYLTNYVSYLLGLNLNQSNFDHARKLEKSILDIFALFIQQPSAPLDFIRFAPRFFLACLLCATITLENIYSGQLKSMLTIPFYGHPVDTIQKFSEAEWKWGAPSIIWVHTIQSSDLVTEQILTRNFEVQDYTYLANASFMPDYGLGIERLSSGSLSVGDYVATEALENRIVLRDDLYFDYTRAVSIRGWVLMPELDKHIRTCQETGLYVYWELQFIVKYMDKKKQEVLMNLANGHKAKGAPQALDVHNIAGALFVLAFGFTFAVCALLAEILIYRLGMSK